MMSTINFNYQNDQTFINIIRKVYTPQANSSRKKDIVNNIVYQGLCVIRQNGTGIVNKPLDEQINKHGYQKATEYRLYLNRDNTGAKEIRENDIVKYNRHKRQLNGNSVVQNEDIVELRVKQVLLPSNVTCNGRVELICISNN